MKIQECEICHQQFIEGYGYSIMASWVVTGHAYVPAFSCGQAEGGQHWGCCPEHAQQAFLNCVQTHMSTTVLSKKHEDTNMPRYSAQDEWAVGLGENFHFVEVIRK